MAALCSCRVPLGRGEGAQEIARRGARTMRARSLSGTRMCLSADLRSVLALVAGQGSGDRGREGAFLFGYFLLGKQEKVTRSQGCERNNTRT